MLTSEVSTERQLNTVMFAEMKEGLLYHYTAPYSDMSKTIPTHYYFRIGNQLLCVAAKPAFRPIQFCDETSGHFQAVEGPATVTLKFT